MSLESLHQVASISGAKKAPATALPVRPNLGFIFSQIFERIFEPWRQGNQTIDLEYYLQTSRTFDSKKPHDLSVFYIVIYKGDGYNAEVTYSSNSTGSFKAATIYQLNIYFIEDRFTPEEWTAFITSMISESKVRGWAFRPEYRDPIEKLGLRLITFGPAITLFLDPLFLNIDVAPINGAGLHLFQELQADGFSSLKQVLKHPTAGK